MNASKLCLNLGALIILGANGLPGQPGMGMGMMGGGMMGGKLPAAMPSDANPITNAKVDLGRILFYDPRFSRSGTISCNSCHDLAKYGVDGKRVSTGHAGQEGDRNSPTVYHAAGQIAQFWDGRAADVEEQAQGPMLNPGEMGMASGQQVVETLQAIKGYDALFRLAFPAEAHPLTFDNMAKAIGAFERQLVTPSRWDRFLAGDRSAITAQEMGGHHEFMHNGCVSCHNGPFVGGGMFQKLGREKPWPVTTDVGRMAVTKSATDRMVFKVPTLRNVAKTAPYFHDGRVGTLEEAVRFMGRHQLGVELGDAQISSIVAWLNTLTGEIPQAYIQPPVMPQ